ncbi:MAG: carboxypeptidase regulatory-like domain-containing protein [Aquificae bacterium]|nr:carboxypeptidase regulatory-like domain-containing protein [Aquificota bacterium]
MKKFVFSLFMLFTAFIFSCSENAPVVSGQESYSVTTVTGYVYTGLNNLMLSMQLPQPATVEVISIAPDGTQIDKQTTTSTGVFSVDIKAKEGGKIIVSAHIPGYTKAIRTLKFPGTDEVSVTLSLDRLQESSFNLNTDGIKMNSNGRSYVRIAFAENGGELVPLTGLQAMNAPDKVIDIGIPLGVLNTDTVTVRYRKYVPSNPYDYRNFPGEEIQDGSKLVSFGFDYLEITDGNGNSVFGGQGLTAQLLRGEYYRILRSIDCTQLNNIRNSLGTLDQDPSKPGIQFTFWAFDTSQGIWVVAGEGVFVENNTIDFMNQEWDTIIQSGCDTGNSSSNNSDGIASCQEYGIIMDENNICDNRDFVVISVTNPELEWKNLDYIAPGNMELSCTVVVKDKNGNPIPGVFASTDENYCMSYGNGVTDVNGRTVISTVGWSGNDCTADITLFHPDLGSITEYGVTFTADGSCNVEITWDIDLACVVEGKVVDENGQPVQGATVLNFIVYQNPDWEMWVTQMVAVGTTDANGEYSIQTPCLFNAFVQVNDRIKNYNIDGSVRFDETSDDGTTARLEDIVITNAPPIGTVNVRNLTPGASTTISVCATDPEGNYPISFVLKENTTTVASGQLTPTQNCTTVSHQIPTSGGTYEFSAEFTDSKGKTAPSQVKDVLVIDGANSNHYIKMTLQGTSELEIYQFLYPITYASSFWLNISPEDSDQTHTPSVTAQYTCYDSDGNVAFQNSTTISSTPYSIFDFQEGVELSYCDFALTVSDSNGLSGNADIRVIFPTRY